MVIKCPGDEWVLKMGPVTRTNEASTRKQAEEGAAQKIDEAARPLVLFLMKGAICPV
jgi:hypothetical protein